MTIQEKAIEQLESVSRHLAAIGEKEDYTGVAIQALEQECEDAVSRRAVLDKAWDVPYDGKYIQVVDVGDIKDLPPVTPAREKGKWINRSSTSCGIRYVASECSCCHKKTFFDCDELLYRYCPNCGAKMEEGEL